MELAVDTEAGAAYVALPAAAVAGTGQLSGSVLIDLDTGGTPFGIEILTLTADVDLDGVAEGYSLSDDLRNALRVPLGPTRRSG